MRGTSRLLANVSRYLEAHSPTGLTGLSTHPAPRPALIYTYRKTLAQLNQLPSSSVYRQSTEALTKQRLKIVEETVPEGYEAWLERVKKQIDASPAAYGELKMPDGSFSYEAMAETVLEPWDGTVTKKSARQEGTNTLNDAERKAKDIQVEDQETIRADKEGELPTVDDLEVEPALTREQISSIEAKIAAGLIEEVISVAEGELELVGEMLKSQPWEELEEQAPTGQWSYFERGDRV